MKVESSAVVAADGTLRRLASAVPLTLRRVRAENSALCALRLVGTAAGPLADDDLTLRLTVEAGARVDLAASGASIAQGRGGGTASLRLAASVGHRASLVADPGALIVCDGSRVEVSVQLVLAATSSVTWYETVVLGRSRDAGTGTARLRWDVTCDTRPVLRQLIDLSDPTLRSWPGYLGGRRVLATALVAGPHVAARTIVADRDSVAQRIDETTALVTVLADDVHVAHARRAELLAPLIRP